MTSVRTLDQPLTESDGGKLCSKCGVVRDISDFYRDARTKDGLFCWCRFCATAYHRVRRGAQPERARINECRTRYGIDFNAPWIKQQGLCAMCGEPMLPYGHTSRSVSVDHDHNCCAGYKSRGKCVRGLIHRRCNLVLGHAEDSVDLLERAVTYLKQRREALT